jgi:hypothetical protein
MWNDENAVGCSPTHVWESAGVMIPFVDMMNHIDDLPQARWRQSNVAEDASARKLSFYIDEKTKKHCQIYRNYGAHDNEAFMLQYGFTRIGNPTDNKGMVDRTAHRVAGEGNVKQYRCSGITEEGEIDQIQSAEQW